MRGRNLGRVLVGLVVAALVAGTVAGCGGTDGPEAARRPADGLAAGGSAAGGSVDPRGPGIWLDGFDGSPPALERWSEAMEARLIDRGVLGTPWQEGVPDETPAGGGGDEQRSDWGCALDLADEMVNGAVVAAARSFWAPGDNGKPEVYVAAMYAYRAGSATALDNLRAIVADCEPLRTTFPSGPVTVTTTGFELPGADLATSTILQFDTGGTSEIGYAFRAYGDALLVQIWTAGGRRLPADEYRATWQAAIDRLGEDS